jgi:hypothetical protein
VFLPTDFTVESKTEQIEKSSNGIISSTLEKTDAILSSLESVPFIGSYANSFRTLTRPGKVLAKAFGLSKPTTLDATSVVKINPYSDMANGKGIDLTMKLCMDPENRVSAVPAIGGINHDEMKLSVLTGTPHLFAIITLDDTSEGTLNLLDVRNTYGEIDFFDVVANQFYYWSGSIKGKIYFTASLMQSARIVFLLLMMVRLIGKLVIIKLLM